MNNNPLLREIIQATGLPENSITNELKTIINKSGKNEDSVGLDELREVLAQYLQEIFSNEENKKGH